MKLTPESAQAILTKGPFAAGKIPRVMAIKHSGDGAELILLGWNGETFTAWLEPVGIAGWLLMADNISLVIEA